MSMMFVVALAVPSEAVEPETSADRFDVTQGAQATTFSGVANFAEAIFGGDGGPPEPRVTFFADAPEDTVHYVEWSVPAAFVLEGFNLRASADSPTLPLQRAFDHFRLQAKVGDDYVTLFESDIAVPNVFVGPEALIASSGVETPVLASQFRAEFTQYETGPGPRIYELDGFGGESCGDATGNETVAASDALAALRSSVGSSRCLHCVCDLDSNGSVVASDALAILRHSVGTNPTLTCPACYLGNDPS
jgi:hypothetical protein